MNKFITINSYIKSGKDEVKSIYEVALGERVSANDVYSSANDKYRR